MQFSIDAPSGTEASLLRDSAHIYLHTALSARDITDAEILNYQYLFSSQHLQKLTRNTFSLAFQISLALPLPDIFIPHHRPLSFTAVRSIQVEL